ncbi:AAA family ATPase [Chitinibacter sp. ZOR0017]|uniref:AAA family ATPase n=1 Tax=Chitinibacter sp. ZOR0017 TaxID=1339254 RepID=UPI000645E358|nr:ATP-binding protein [Chitinibacter sp. ZOR0017]
MSTPTVNHELEAAGLAQIGNLTLVQEALMSAVGRHSGLPGLVCFYGPSGWGKSVSANVVANRTRARYVQAKSVWTKKHFLKAVLFEMGIKPAGTVAEMLDQAAEEMAASQRPLIVDEMDHLVDKNAVEVVRDLYEASHAPILLIGEEQLPHKLKRWERFHGRVLAWVPAQPVDLSDARALRSVYSNDIEIADDLLNKTLEAAHGSVRRVAVNLNNIRKVALELGRESMDLKAWGSRPLFTGDAPKRRV